MKFPGGKYPLFATSSKAYCRFLLIPPGFQLSNWNNYHCTLLGKTEEQKHSQRGGVLMVHSETGAGGGTLSYVLCGSRACSVARV